MAPPRKSSAATPVLNLGAEALPDAFGVRQSPDPVKTRVGATYTATPKIQVEHRRLETLKPNLRNARTHSRAQIKKLAKLISHNGFLVPLLIQSDGTIIAGHGRFEAAQLLGLTEVPVVVVTHLTSTQMTALSIADNKVALESDWDLKILALEFRDLCHELDFDPTLTGFEMCEIDLQIDSIESIGGTAARITTEDRLPELPLTPKPISAVGDIWILRQHRVGCGDARDANFVKLVMKSRLADIVVSDAPYNCRVSDISGLGATQHPEFKMASGEMSAVEFVTFLRTGFRQFIRHTRQGSVHFLFMDWRGISAMMDASKDLYTAFLNLCVWVKDNGGMGSLHRSQHELCFAFRNGSLQHINNVQLGKYGRNRTNVWRYPGVNAFARQTEEGRLGLLHPTVKPVQMLADAILDCSNRGDLVLDLFLGSGSTLIAAERVGRICYGTEIDPIYVDLIVRRWQAYSGEQAVLESTGQTFNDVAIAQEATHV